MKEFTLSELTQYDGKEGRPAYIAYKKRVYDVSQNNFWKEGGHFGVHRAGVDLTQGLANAPHGEDVIEKLSLVGELADIRPAGRPLIEKIMGIHPHPITAHFTVAYGVLVPILSILFFLTGKWSFESLSYTLLLLAFFSSPFTAISGYISWRIKFEKRLTKVFVTKIRFTILFIVVLGICCFWRAIDPDILIDRSFLSYIFLALEMSLLPIIVILGHTGGKLVHS